MGKEWKATPKRVKKLYQDAIFEVFGVKSKDQIFKSDNRRLKLAIKEGVHLIKDAPGGFGNSWDTLEIYCENGIPNASDIHDFRAEALEFGADPTNAVSYNSDKWDEIDGIVNLFLEAIGTFRRFHHEPYNNAVIIICEDIPF